MSANKEDSLLNKKKEKIIITAIGKIKHLAIENLLGMLT